MPPPNSNDSEANQSSSTDCQRYFDLRLAAHLINKRQGFYIDPKSLRNLVLSFFSPSHGIPLWSFVVQPKACRALIVASAPTLTIPVLREMAPWLFDYVTGPGEPGLRERRYMPNAVPQANAVRSQITIRAEGRNGFANNIESTLLSFEDEKLRNAVQKNKHDTHTQAADESVTAVSRIDLVRLEAEFEQMAAQGIPVPPPVLNRGVLRGSFVPDEERDRLLNHFTKYGVRGEDLEPLLMTREEMMANGFPLTYLLENGEREVRLHMSDLSRLQAKRKLEEELAKPERDPDLLELPVPGQRCSVDRGEGHEYLSTLVEGAEERKYVLLAMDCEMVLTTSGNLELARVTAVDEKLNTVYDEFVMPTHPVMDYLTRFSGITEEILSTVTKTLLDVRDELLDLISPDTVLVGHSLDSDLSVLRICHERVIDTSVLFPHPAGAPIKWALRVLTERYLNRKIQGIVHDSAEDSIATLQIVFMRIVMGARMGRSSRRVYLAEAAQACNWHSCVMGPREWIAGALPRGTSCDAIPVESGAELRDRVCAQLQRPGKQFIWAEFPRTDVSSTATATSSAAETPRDIYGHFIALLALLEQNPGAAMIFLAGPDFIGFKQYANEHPMPKGDSWVPPEPKVLEELERLRRGTVFLCCRHPDEPQRAKEPRRKTPPPGPKKLTGTKHGRKEEEEESPEPTVPVEVTEKLTATKHEREGEEESPEPVEKKKKTGGSKKSHKKTRVEEGPLAGSEGTEVKEKKRRKKKAKRETGEPKRKKKSKKTSSKHKQ